MQAWVLFTVLAAFMQAIRTAGQKRLAQNLSSMATTLIRYLFGLPVVIVYFAWVFPADHVAVVSNSIGTVSYTHLTLPTIYSV